MLTRQEGLQEHFWLDQGHTGVDMGTFVSHLKTLLRLCWVFVIASVQYVWWPSMSTVHLLRLCAICSSLSFSTGGDVEARINKRLQQNMTKIEQRHPHRRHARPRSELDPAELEGL